MMTLFEDNIKFLEKKHGCDLQAFEKSIKQSLEDFERWDDFIEWKAYSESIKELEARIKMIEHIE